MDNKAAPESKKVTLLINALRFEKAKNKALLDEVIAAEDLLANRELEQYGDAIAPETKDFWRDQLLTNRAQAEIALAQFVALQNRSATQQAPAPAAATRQPLHNRATVQIKQPNTQGDSKAPTAADENKALEIRNRAKEIRTSNGLPFAQAFRQAEKEILNKVR